MNGGERLKVKDLQSAVEALGFELCKLTIPGKYCLIKNLLVYKVNGQHAFTLDELTEMLDNHILDEK